MTCLRFELTGRQKSIRKSVKLLFTDLRRKKPAENAGLIVLFLVCLARYDLNRVNKFSFSKKSDLFS